MDLTFTNVFYEKTFYSAERRLALLRKKDTYPEIKAYIIQTDEGLWRVFRRIRIPSSKLVRESIPQTEKKVIKCKQLKIRKAGQ